MSPILVRPVREQLEHDRLIRHLEGKYSKKKFDVAMNLGDEQVAPIRVAALTLYPDIVLTTAKKLAGVIEVETGESVNKLETMAQWVHFGKSKVPFHLYVPVPNYDAARRLCEAFQVKVAEIWTYRGVLDGFDLVRMFHDSAASAQPPRNAPAIPVAEVRGRDAVECVASADDIGTRRFVALCLHRRGGHEGPREHDDKSARTEDRRLHPRGLPGSPRSHRWLFQPQPPRQPPMNARVPAQRSESAHRSRCHRHHASQA